MVRLKSIRSIDSLYLFVHYDSVLFYLPSTCINNGAHDDEIIIFGSN